MITCTKLMSQQSFDQIKPNRKAYFSHFNLQIFKKNAHMTRNVALKHLTQTPSSNVVCSK